MTASLFLQFPCSPFSPPLTHRYSEDNGEVFGFLGVCAIEFYFALMNVHFRGEFELHSGW